MGHQHNHVKNSTQMILLAFLANLLFSILEFIFGALFNSSAILADSLHDFGDALAIGLSYYFEMLSQKESDNDYTLGYRRFSLLGAMVTSTVLIIGSLLVILENIDRVMYPEPVNSQGMLILGVIAIVVNLGVSRVLSGEHSEQTSLLSLHFIEDTLGWLGVIVVSIVLQFTDWYLLDSLLSVGISLFILFKAVPKWMSHLTILLEKSPANLDIESLRAQIMAIDGVKSINQFNLWSIDGQHHMAMIHVQVAEEISEHLVRDWIHHTFQKNGIIKSAIECDQSAFEHQHHC